MFVTYKFIVGKRSRGEAKKKLTISKFFRSFNWIELQKQETLDLGIYNSGCILLQGFISSHRDVKKIVRARSEETQNVNNTTFLLLHIYY